MIERGEGPVRDDADDMAAVRLLQIAGARPAVPPDRAARARARIHAEWRADVHRRSARRKKTAIIALAAAEAVALFVGRAVLESPPAFAPGDLVATIERVEGAPRLGSATSGSFAAVTVAQQVRTGDWLETGADARLALRFGDGTSVRLDVESRMRPLSASAIELASGAVYVDTGTEAGRFEVQTPLATARDIGTQFEVRLAEGTLRLRVRTGIVELRDKSRFLTGRAGTELILSPSGAESRSLTPYGADWEWTTQLAPPLEIEGVTLRAFLERLSREQGWSLRYPDPALSRDAASIVLHGSVEGLSEEEALEVAIATSGLRHHLERGELVVTRGAQ